MKQTQLKRKSTFSTSSSQYKPLKSKAKLKSAKPIKVDMWSLTEADKIFAQSIRERDERCQQCLTSMYLGCSHYGKREIYATRFDPDNCITLCVGCHMWLERNLKEYMTLMVKRLGVESFVALEKRMKQRVSKEEAIRALMKSRINELREIQF